MGISSGISGAEDQQGSKMVLWVTIRNPASGLVVALSSNSNGAQLHLEKEVDGEACQLWDYHEATTNNFFRNKLGYVADVRAHVGPELICWKRDHGGKNQKFCVHDGSFITSEIPGGKVWDVEKNRLVPGGKLMSGPSTAETTSSSASRSVASA